MATPFYFYGHPSRAENRYDRVFCYEVIRILITVSLHEDQDSNHCSTDSNLDFRKGLNGCSMREIQIPIQRIRIQILVRCA